VPESFVAFLLAYARLEGSRNGNSSTRWQHVWLSSKEIGRRFIITAYRLPLLFIMITVRPKLFSVVRSANVAYLWLLPRNSQHRRLPISWRFIRRAIKYSARKETREMDVYRDAPLAAHNCRAIINNCVIAYENVSRAPCTRIEIPSFRNRARD